MKKAIKAFEEKATSWTKCTYLSSYMMSRMDAFLDVLPKGDKLTQATLQERANGVFAELMSNRIRAAQRLVPFDMADLFDCLAETGEINSILKEDLNAIGEVGIRQIPLPVLFYRVFLYRMEIGIPINLRTIALLREVRPEVADTAAELWEEEKRTINAQLATMQQDIANGGLGKYL